MNSSAASEQSVGPYWETLCSLIDTKRIPAAPRKTRRPLHRITLISLDPRKKNWML